MYTDKGFKIIAVCMCIIFFCIIALAIYSIATEEPNTCIIKTKEETIIGKNCYGHSGCISYTNEGIEYGLCGDFKVYLIKGGK